MSVQPYALVIEETHKNAKYFADILSLAGYQTQTVNSGHEAQVQLTFTNPDLILIHLPLAMMKAGVLLRQIRGNRRLRGTRVLGVTSDPAGASDLADKLDLLLAEPVSEQQLRQLAERLLPHQAAI
jgi:CheY-like chemotaxis protein